jgi:hypothetical protein
METSEVIGDSDENECEAEEEEVGSTGKNCRIFCILIIVVIIKRKIRVQYH